MNLYNVAFSPGFEHRTVFVKNNLTLSLKKLYPELRNMNFVHRLCNYLNVMLFRKPNSVKRQAYIVIIFYIKNISHRFFLDSFQYNMSYQFIIKLLFKCHLRTLGKNLKFIINALLDIFLKQTKHFVNYFVSERFLFVLGLFYVK